MVGNRLAKLGEMMVVEDDVDVDHVRVDVDHVRVDRRLFWSSSLSTTTTTYIRDSHD